MIEIKGHTGYFIDTNGVIYNSHGKIIKPRIRKSTGYYAVVLYKPKKSHYVHRLIAEHFIDNPNNKNQVNHKDGDKSNNTIDNLEWVTHSENELHSYRVLGKKPTYGKSSLCIKIKAVKGDIIQEFESMNDAIGNTGYSRVLIRKFINQSRKDPDGFSWYNT